ncbi:cytochrome P450 [Gautieria morchelliformis]|nr:cytochrome P450 [Gautieria morchelliformis]
MLGFRCSQLDLLAIASVVLLLCYLHTKKQNAKPPLHPGPNLPTIIGNMRKAPGQKLWETYNSWAEEYGKLINSYLWDVVNMSTSCFGSHTILLNSFKVAYDLLERRSSIYSSRAHYTMFHDLVGAGGATAFQPYGKKWRKHRTLFQKYMNQTAVKVFQTQQLVAARGLLRSLLKTPEEYQEHITDMTAGVVMGIAYGREIVPKADPFIALSQNNSAAFAAAVRRGGYLVNVFPMLKYVPAWVPGAGFQKQAQEMRKLANHFRNAPFREVKSRVSAGTARPCFVSSALFDLGTDDESNDDVDAVKHVAGGLFGAGFRTTSASIHTFILAMVLYPDVQKKAQAELDSVIGHERLPEFSDRPHLPYIEAIVKEVFRWIPVLPTAIHHVTTEDDVYEGHRIPANSVVIPNCLQVYCILPRILHDPDMYPNPYAFCPERFLPDKDGFVARDPAIGGIFGFGRRVCPGRHFADAFVWVTAASILSVFDITNAVDNYGRKIDVNYARDPASSFLSQPRPFKCSITPRSSAAEAMIMQLE